MTTKDKVLKRIVQGMTNKEIAQEIFISRHTVKAYVAQLMRENNAKNRTDLAYKKGVEDGKALRI